MFPSYVEEIILGLTEFFSSACDLKMQVLTEFFLCNVGDDCDKFTIQITHNGFFVGLRGTVEYASSTTDWFDNCSRDTFSVLWIQDFVKQLGHPDNGRTHVYWMSPGKGIEEGFFCIESDAHTLMTTEVAKEQKTLALIVDHTNFLENIRPDVIVQDGLETAETSMVVEQHCEADEEEKTNIEFYKYRSLSERASSITDAPATRLLRSSSVGSSLTVILLDSLWY